MKRFAKACAAVSMALMMSTAVGFAAETEHPNMDHGTTNKAAVSDEVDTALNITPKMGTKFTVYLAPDIPETIPLSMKSPRWVMWASTRKRCWKHCWSRVAATL